MSRRRTELEKFSELKSNLGKTRAECFSVKVHTLSSPMTERRRAHRGRGFFAKQKTAEVIGLPILQGAAVVFDQGFNFTFINSLVVINRKLYKGVLFYGI